jgi:outer membrane receptor protein involved in Fe transport
VYTVPDTIGNRSPALNVFARRTVNSAVTVSGNAYYRKIRTEGINGNLNNESLGESVYQPSAADITALKNAGYTGYPASGANAANTPFPKWRCIAQALQFSEPIEKCNALIVYSKTIQSDFGVSGQLAWTRSADLFGSGAGRNQFAMGFAYSRGWVAFTQNTQFGYLNPDRSVTGVAAWEDGTTNSNGDPVDTRVSLDGSTPNISLFATDTWTPAKAWNLTVSGRFNRNSIRNTDRLHPVAGRGSLTGNNTYQRFNPAVGLTYSPAGSWNLYASYIQGSRAPTSIELGCADPVDPCTLPNALASDPPLRQVVTGTWQVGLRGKGASAKEQATWNWNLGAFTATNTDDILFIASQQTGSGYFKNFGKTRRRGIQASADGRYRKLTGGLDFTFLDATYQSSETLSGNGNNTADLALAGFPGLGGTITIHAGNRIPLIPKQTGKAYVDFQATSKFVLGWNLVAASSSYARGNENNAYKADGKYYQGPGVSPGYAVLNFRAHYDLTRRLAVSAQVDNVLDRHYFTAAQLANTGLTPQGTYVARLYPAYTKGEQAGNYPVPSVTFFAPGAPRRAWAELRVRF